MPVPHRRQSTRQARLAFSRHAGLGQAQSPGMRWVWGTPISRSSSREGAPGTGKTRSGLPAPLAAAAREAARTLRLRPMQGDAFLSPGTSGPLSGKGNLKATVGLEPKWLRMTRGEWPVRCISCAMPAANAIRRKAWTTAAFATTRPTRLGTRGPSSWEPDVKALACATKRPSATTQGQ